MPIPVVIAMPAAMPVAMAIPVTIAVAGISGEIHQLRDRLQR